MAPQAGSHRRDPSKTQIFMEHPLWPPWVGVWGIDMVLRVW